MKYIIQINNKSVNPRLLLMFVFDKYLNESVTGNGMTKTTRKDGPTTKERKQATRIQYNNKIRVR